MLKRVASASAVANAVQGMTVQEDLDQFIKDLTDRIIQQMKEGLLTHASVPIVSAAATTEVLTMARDTIQRETAAVAHVKAPVASAGVEVCLGDNEPTLEDVRKTDVIMKQLRAISHLKVRKTDA